MKFRPGIRRSLLTALLAAVVCIAAAEAAVPQTPPQGVKGGSVSLERFRGKKSIVRGGRMPLPDSLRRDSLGRDSLRTAVDSTLLRLDSLGGALLQVYPNTTFTEMFCPDWEQDVILLSHMGESNPKLAQWKPLISDCPFNYNSCGDTTAMYNCLRKGKAVYVNLAPMQDHFTLIVSDVEMLDEGLERGAYRHSTQGWMKPCKPLPQFLKEFSLAGGTHHSALVYDANIEEIKAFGTMMGFEVIEIK